MPLAAAAAVAVAVAAALAAPAAAAPTAETPHGTYHGRTAAQGASEAFLGIRYAVAERFHEPVAVDQWLPLDERPDIDASQPGPKCPQLNTPPSEMSEDCLRLNVFRPAGADAPLPVLVYVHGGSFLSGAGFSDDTDASRWAARQDVVVVTINYRLGPLGFLALSPGVDGNQGLMDMHTALAWISRNIAAFGGDEARVTLFGESAGAHAVCDLNASPLTAPDVFHATIMQSGRCSTDYPSLPAMREGSERLAAAVGCSRGDEVSELVCLQHTDIEVLLTALPAEPYFVPAENSIRWAPVVGSAWLPEQPDVLIEKIGVANKRPTIIGSNADEGTVFTLSELGQDLDLDGYNAATHFVLELLVPDNEYIAQPVQYNDTDHDAEHVELVQEDGREVAIEQLRAILDDLYPLGDKPFETITEWFGDYRYRCPARRAARLLASGDVPVAVYSFEEADRIEPVRGAAHADEIKYVFDAPSVPAEADLADLAAAMSGYWASFAQNPTAGPAPPAGRPAWPRFTPDAMDDLRFAASNIRAGAVFADPVMQARCDFWDAHPPHARDSME